jgi:hypothetical protein
MASILHCRSKIRQANTEQQNIVSDIFKFAFDPLKKKVCIWTMNHPLGVAEAILVSDSSKGNCLYQSHDNMCIFSFLVA